ncbi:MAG: RNA polymerase sigma factor [Flavobacteriaceae bacterium]|nr:RNA polymerase sigma factor [Flavobacteriaceae bacterium]
MKIKSGSNIYLMNANITNESKFIQKLLDRTQRDVAFKQLLDLYQERIYWHIRKIVITHDNANDVLQNTFMRVYKSLPKFKQNSSLHTWMYKIAYNESLRFIEQNKKRYYVSIDDVNNKYLDNLEEDTYFDASYIQLKLQNILSKMPEKQRQVFQMKYYDDLKFREIVAILGIKEGSLKTLYYGAVSIIKKSMIAEDACIKSEAS